MEDAGVGSGISGWILNSVLAIVAGLLGRIFWASFKPLFAWLAIVARYAVHAIAGALMGLWYRLATTRGGGGTAEDNTWHVPAPRAGDGDDDDDDGDGEVDDDDGEEELYALPDTTRASSSASSSTRPAAAAVVAAWRRMKRTVSRTGWLQIVALVVVLAMLGIQLAKEVSHYGELYERELFEQAQLAVKVAECEGTSHFAYTEDLDRYCRHVMLVHGSTPSARALRALVGSWWSPAGLVASLATALGSVGGVVIVSALAIVVAPLLWSSWVPTYQRFRRHLTEREHARLARLSQRPHAAAPLRRRRSASTVVDTRERDD